MYPNVLMDANLYVVLQQIDEDMAAEARQVGCACGGVLHSARFPRKPRGGPADLGPGYGFRLSFCCNRDRCRGRTTPPSVRFLGRKVYLGAVVVVATVLRHGVTRFRAERLRQLFGVSRQTLVRWRQFWRSAFVTSPFWKQARGRLLPGLAAEDLPASLLARFLGDAAEKLRQFLQFVSPITTASGPPIGLAP